MCFLFFLGRQLWNHIASFVKISLALCLYLDRTVRDSDRRWGKGEEMGNDQDNTADWNRTLSRFMVGFLSPPSHSAPLQHFLDHVACSVLPYVDREGTKSPVLSITGAADFIINLHLLPGQSRTQQQDAANRFPSIKKESEPDMW